MLEAFVFAWELRPDVVFVLGVLAVGCTLGWWRLRRRRHRQLAAGWRLASYLAGLAVLALALLSGVDHLQERLFSAHMIQHELVMMVAPPLLLLTDPFPFFLWALPVNIRRGANRLLARGTWFRRLLRSLTSSRVAWGLYVAALWIWHSPAAYQAGLREEWIHNLEHLTFFGTALLFWWHIIDAGPRLRRLPGHWFRAGYVLAALAQNEMLGVGIAFADAPLYEYYTQVPRLWNISVMQDQMVAGAIMWIPGGMMYAVAAVLLIVGVLDEEERPRRAAQPLLPPGVSGLQAEAGQHDG